MIGKLLDWHRERRARHLAIAEAQWQHAENNLPFLLYLGPDDRARLRLLARRFIADKQWSTAENLSLNADMQLAIALQACLPVLNLGLEWYSDWVGIVIYPGDFIIPRQWMDETGIVHEFDDEVLGEAWDGGPVLLSWFDTGHAPTAETLQGETPINIVIHEFAHKLDMRHGVADGMPPLHPGMSRETWQRTMQDAFEDINLQLDRGEPIPIDPYGAEDPAEFFAVCSESFFTRPNTLLQDYPEVYAQLTLFYRQNPAAIQPGKALLAPV